MFGAEPQERWTAEDRAEFDIYAAGRLRRMFRTAAWATAIFVTTIVAIIPFLAGHSLHLYWDGFGKYLIFVAEAELLWFVLRWGYVYSAWQSARETRREMSDPD